MGVRLSPLLRCVGIFISIGALSIGSAAADVGTLADSDGSVVGWGRNDNGQTLSQIGPFVAVATGYPHSLGLNGDGSVVGWGGNVLGSTNPQAGPFIAIAASYQHSLGLQADGSVVGWGSNSNGQGDPQVGPFVAIGAGFFHSLGLKADGSVIGWGDNTHGQSSFVAGPFVDIDVGGTHNLGLKADGSVVAWGQNNFGQANPQSGTFTDIAAGVYHSLALKPDGSVVGWGRNVEGQANPQSGPFTAIGAGQYHSIGLKPDGSVVGWGLNSSGQTIPQTGPFVAISTDTDHNLAMRARSVYGGDLLVSGSGVAANLNRSITVAGDATVQTATNFYNNPIAAIAGDLVLHNGAAFSGSGTINSAGMEVDGSATINAGQSFTVGASGGTTISATGSITIAGGSVDLKSLTNNGGAISFLSGALSYIGNLTVGSGGLLGSDLTLAADRQLTLSGTTSIDPTHTLLLDGGTLSTGALAINGNFNFHKGTLALTGAGGLTIGGSGPLGAMVVLNSDQTLEVTNTLTVNAGSRLILIDAGGLSAGTLANSGDLVAIDSAIEGAVVNNAAVTVIGTVDFNGLVSGPGNFYGPGTANFNGGYSPGASPAEVNFEGEVAFGGAGTLNIELGGTGPGEFDALAIEGAADLAGVLEVTLLGSYEPRAGDAFEILSAGELNGTFANEELPELDGLLFWDVDYDYTSDLVSLSVVSPFTADFDGDGDVDAEDLGIWNSAYSATTLADADGDGDSDGRDFLAWQTQYTGDLSSLATGIAVPEPTSPFVLIWCVAWQWKRRGQSRHLAQWPQR